jgi:hypothetical protein
MALPLSTSGLQLQLCCTLASSGREPLVLPALLIGPTAAGRSRLRVNQYKCAQVHYSCLNHEYCLLDIGL